MTQAVIKFSIQRMVCTGCGAEANASCNCGVAYQPKAVRAREAVEAHPEKSNRAIADAIGADEKEVRRQRAKLEAAGMSAVQERIGLDNKTRRLPSKNANKNKETVILPNPSASAADRAEARCAANWNAYQRDETVEGEGDAVSYVLTVIQTLTDEERSRLFQTLKDSYQW